ncbi:MAG: biopolymer transporter ExbD [Flavobacteriales bacterium CG_4_9_14_0_2_um_filter_35_242]|nr:biopolymer transporter ExbD [Zetaproteobacteria bacterium]OIO10573.1 MAG: biopolymer transporter ExbD [Flavobacteriaceae bacterium CG1_02_35_72]PIR12576.1 MAG: biopolymer transporter ExbD [Flavobacteriales bacterium CG11_big_fil_rev_8_21_14_0_20_35_7]PJA05006.1 MAG: biopolymer transporter ExbD [Flavobacteriales bacterium CG_4_10_14_0_2_um_filter_35_18]PJC59647.1 MAG: biopolymer transporter ExbD [Flavobacteriales bacterium CG_4_9_14_0_2_um_filter_35_242]
MARRDTPEINAGSMADIAFLLLIFFLVTTTMDVTSGISRKLPEKPPKDAPPPPKIKERNIFEVTINRNNMLFVEGGIMDINDLREAAKKFIDNGGGTISAGTEKNDCDYCEGEKDPNSSDNPSKAIISLQNDRGTAYKTYIAVQNELVAAYSEIRDRYSLKKFGRRFGELTTDQQKVVKDAYPQIISEAEPNKS